MTSQIKKYFKNQIDNRYKDWDITIALRYLPIVDDLNLIHQPDEKILEVGSEITGITTYLKKPVTGLDVSFDLSKKNSYLTPIKGTACSLPFDQSTFEYVLSVDMLEHLPEKKRPKAIDEMVRVTKKKMYLSFPCGKAASQADHQLHYYYLKRRGSPYPYLEEHIKLGLPNGETIKKMLLDYKKFKLKVYNNTNIFLWNTLLKWGLSNDPLKSSFYRRALLITPLLKKINFQPVYRKLFILERK